jgi:two-component system phosphate regulon sensor histidine kinase PhoR
MPGDKILLITDNTGPGVPIDDFTLSQVGYQVTSVQGQGTAQSTLKSHEFDLVIIEVGVNPAPVFLFLDHLFNENPAACVILIGHSADSDLILRAFRKGVTEYLTMPLRLEDVLTAIQASLKRRENLQAWIQTQTKRNTEALQNRIDELVALVDIGHLATVSLDLDQVLTTIVDTAVTLTGAEEGSLLILDEESGELLMRASRNFQDDFVRMFHLPVNDTLAGEVIRKGVPVMINEDTPQKIKTAYLVRTLMYVPLVVSGKVIGVLGVDNRESDQSFSQQHLTLLSTLAEYAAVTIENARLYSMTEVERHKLDSILTQIEDGVIVIGDDNRVVMVNPTARVWFDLVDKDILEKPVDEVFQHEALLEIFKGDHDEMPYRSEITLDDGYVFNVHLVKIPEVGFAVTIQDITYFKELDRIKTEFVNTVSHDLRSPLTAILGYVELISRVGEINDQQREFIQRVQISVRNISELINNLLELGRIEAGFDSHKEYVPLGVIVQYAIDGIENKVKEKNLELSVDISENLPDVFDNPARLQQVMDNLLGNAIRYTPEGGRIEIRLASERDQVILQVEDTGLGIPLQDQPHIFDKFFRASNVPMASTGSGLGLAIVKSIVENHKGRVWVDSTPGTGSCFTVVLPVTKGVAP